MKELIVNDTKIVVEETELGLVININTDNAKVIVNGNLIWEKFENPDYEFVLPKLRDYLLNHTADINVGDKDLTADFYMCKEDIMMILPKNKNSRKNIIARVNFILGLEDLKIDLNDRDFEETEIDDIINKLKDSYEIIFEKIKEFGYKFQISHATGDYYYAWWDIIIKNNEWDENKFEKIIKLINSFNENLYKIENEYKLC